MTHSNGDTTRAHTNIAALDLEAAQRFLRALDGRHNEITHGQQQIDALTDAVNAYTAPAPTTGRNKQPPDVTLRAALHAVMGYMDTPAASAAHAALQQLRNDVLNRPTGKPPLAAHRAPLPDETERLHAERARQQHP